jgi:hypothetical protein
MGSDLQLAQVPPLIARQRTFAGANLILVVDRIG